MRPPGEGSCVKGDYIFCPCGPGSMDGRSYCTMIDGEWRYPDSCECMDVYDQPGISCDQCSGGAVASVCYDKVMACNENQACVSMHDCWASNCIGDDDDCFFMCAKDNPTGVDDYIEYWQCVDCNACPRSCAGSMFCGTGCEVECTLKFPVGVIDFNAMVSCRVCHACSLDCGESCSETLGNGACNGFSDCNSCIASDCANDVGAAENAACEDNPDCKSLSDCLSSCL